MSELEQITDPRPAPCKVCGGDSLLAGVVDFHKSCIEGQGKRLALSGRPVYYRRCMKCGFVFTTAFDAWDFAAFSANIYNGDYIVVDPDFVELRPSSNAKLVAEAFAGAKASISILDYGGGAGLFAAKLCAEGFNAATYDPFSEFNQMPSDRFDLVTSFEVMEHVPDPKSTVAKMVSLLKAPGAILFSTLVQPPEFESVGLNWWYAAPRNGHISLYSTQALARLFEAHGMRVASFSSNLHIAYAAVPEFAAHLKIPR